MTPTDKFLIKCDAKTDPPNDRGWYLILCSPHYKQELAWYNGRHWSSHFATRDIFYPEHYFRPATLEEIKQYLNNLES